MIEPSEIKPSKRLLVASEKLHELMSNDNEGSEGGIIETEIEKLVSEVLKLIQLHEGSRYYS